jgi:23S rRNA (guanosine2251-2'-O)-methyltransferase
MKRRGEQKQSRHQSSAQHERGVRPKPARQNGPNLTTSPAHSAAGQLYGVAPVLEALRAGQRAIERITIAEGVRHTRLRELVELARRASVPVHYAPRVDLSRSVGANANHQGVIATIAAASYADAEEVLDELAGRVGTDEPPLAVVLDGVEDPRNLGAILRTAECAGAHGVFVPERRAAGLTETVAKAAAGALEHIRVARATNLTRLIEQLKERNIWTVGTSADAPLLYTAWDWTQPAALFLGGEGSGLHRLVRERCDTLVSIPVKGHIESLNVSVAAGIVLYEAVRQRTIARVSAASI